MTLPDDEKDGRFILQAYHLIRDGGPMTVGRVVDMVDVDIDVDRARGLMDGYEHFAKDDSDRYHVRVMNE